MIDCVLSLPLSAWRFEDDIFEHMTLQSWNSCRGHCVGDCVEVRDFMEDLGCKLNQISNRGSRSNRSVNLFHLNLQSFGDLEVVLTTSDDSISVKSFMEIVNSQLVELFKEVNVKSHYNKLIFDDSIISTNRIAIRRTRASIVKEIESTFR